MQPVAAPDQSGPRSRTALLRDGRAVLRGEGMSVVRGGRQILRPTTIDVGAGELVALIGPSGSGKTTLLRALAGVSVPTDGSVELDRDPIALRQTEVGYLPFGDTVHDRLTIREELCYAAALRLPGLDTASAHARVGEVLALLHLEHRADARIGTLSGGERRRAACAVELLARPAMLLLDEPSTGLDPVLERHLMQTLREVADDGRGVLVTTHATSSLALCDRVAVMGPGGRLVFCGTPQETLAHFDVSGYDEIYLALGPADAADTEHHRPEKAARMRPPRSTAPRRAQIATLTHRYWTTMRRDKRTLTLTLAQAPIIGLLIGLVLPRDVVVDDDLGPFYTLLYMFLILTGSVWLGIIGACREVVKERHGTAREVAAGLRLDAYLLSKLAVLLPLVAVQVAALVAVAVVVQPLHEGVGVHLAVYAIAMLAACAAIALGLLVSALVRSVDQATAAVPLLLIPQLLFAGAIIPTAAMPGAVEPAALVVFARWGLVGMGSAMGMGGEDAETLGELTGFEENFFDLGAVGAAPVLVGFVLLTMAVAWFAMQRRVLDID